MEEKSVIVLYVRLLTLLLEVEYKTKKKVSDTILDLEKEKGITDVDFD